MTTRALPILYCTWAAISITFAVTLAGLTPESITRLLVIAFLLLQLPLRSVLARAFSRFAPRARFIALGTLLAAVVEGFHMISVPVFPSLRITPATPLAQGILNYALDLLFTVPAYLVIFSVIWYFINRYEYGLWQYILLMGSGQAIGDGGLFFFLAAPAMLFFLPYPMSNYHAVNILPFLAARDHLSPDREVSTRAYLVVPALIGTYLCCGALIQGVGRWAGLA
ncbi:MAG: hypothetical protein HY319_13270 [Armatimonadetes bacterium]|nr:hypothetical protein [Armatimonadota bacterium]